MFVSTSLFRSAVLLLLCLRLRLLLSIQSTVHSFDRFGSVRFVSGHFSLLLFFTVLRRMKTIAAKA